MKIKIGINIIACVVILMVMTPGVLALVPAVPPQPSYIQDSSDLITVDGNYLDDWELDTDFFANMYKGGNPDNDITATLYLRYDCETEILYALVLSEYEYGGYTLHDSPTNMWIKEDSLAVPNKKIVGMDPGDTGTIVYVNATPSGPIIGYEASGSLAPEEYTQFEAHAQIVDGISVGDTSSTGKDQYDFIPLKIVCNEIPIPEFPTIALPIAAILGLMFILQSRRRKED